VTSYSALSPVSAAIYFALNVPALTDLVPGGVNDVVPQGNVRPYVFFEVSNPTQHGGFGTYPGHGDVPELELRIHGISDQENVSQCQAIVAMAIGLLFEAPLSVAGYIVCSALPMPDIQILNLGDQVIANVVVHEEVAIIRLIVENAAA
jgi:hypothetical protein